MDLASETNRLRLQFLSAELDLSFTFAEIAAVEFATGERQHARQSLADARKGWETVARFLADPKHSLHLSDSDTHTLQHRLHQLENKITLLT